ncbi:galactitol-1-phosphate 5-dehydrogenase [Pseudobutyrivibrio sp. LB2011]|uniref:galactitol-1-phosphate 5-dehydrogenase n=1 Tax=Pseudobutyrivibrio sp. LB2011 TaxID=1408312 RepID=UPI0005D20D3F|nr:galactitol-1-phosphate 5-dehydrogenase [Pseudobutyrivibrio sp. LB2011]
MKALVLKSAGKLNIDEVALPECGAGEVLVKVGACGICGSDIPRAYRDGAHNMPLVIGHEFAGTVEATGKRVGVFPLIPCGKCSCCLEKKYEMCSDYSYLGSRRDGGFAEYVAVPEWNLIELPEKVTMQQAAMLEPMAVAVHALRQAFGKDLEKADIVNANIVVMGLGTIGLLMCMFLLDLGAKNLYVIGNKDSQKRRVVALGVPEDHYLDVADGAVIESLRPQVFFECVGKDESFLKGIEIAAPSGTVCVVGNPHGDMDLPRDIYWKILRKQLTLVGTWNSSFTHEKDDDWHYVIDRLQQGRIHPEELISHRYKLEDILDGFEIMRDKKEEYVKVMGEI